MSLKTNQHDTKTLLSWLKSEDPEQRESAAWQLGRSPDPGNVDLLIALLEDDNRNVCYAAIRSLVILAGQEVIQKTTALLRSENVELRNQAVEILARIGTEALDELTPLVRDSDQDVRKFIVDILGMIKGKGSEKLLLEALFDENTNVAVTAAEGLGKVGSADAVPYLTACLTREPWLKCAALKSLGAIGGEAALAAIMGVAMHEEQIVLYTAVSAIARMADIRCMDFLVALLEKGIPSLEAPVIQAMEKIINRSYAVSLKKVEKKVLPGKILPLLRHDNKEIQRSAIVLTGLLRITEAVPDLCRLYKESNFDLFTELNEAIARIAPQDVSPLIAILASPHDSHSVKAATLKLIGQLDTEGSFIQLAPWLKRVNDELRIDIAAVCAGLSDCPDAFLLALLSDQSAAIRKIAAEALANSTDPKCVDQLLQLARDPATDVQLAAARSLSTMDLSRKKKQLSEMLQSADANIRLFSLTMIPESLAEEYRESTITCCSDTHSSVRQAAVAKAVFLAKESWTQVIDTALSDNDENVRLTAIRALEKRGDQQSSIQLLAIAGNEQADWNRYEAVQAIGRLGFKEGAVQLVPLFASATNLVKAAILDVFTDLHITEGRESALAVVESDHDLVREAAMHFLERMPMLTPGER